MAKISNTTVYPTVTPADNDLLILTDATDSNKTKTVLMSGVKSYVNALAEGVYIKSVNVTSFQILNMLSIPTVLIDGVAGHHIVPISTIGKYTFGTVAYNMVTSIFNITGGASISNFNQIYAFRSEVLSQTTDTAFLPQTLDGSAGRREYVSPAGGDALILRSGADNTLGDGTLTFDIMYRLVKA